MKCFIRHPTWIVFGIAVAFLSAYLYHLDADTEHELTETACGKWVSKHYRSSFNLFQEDGVFYMEMQREKWGTSRIDTYRITKHDGLYLVNIGFPMLLSYDQRNDVLFLSSGGEYFRN